jgi:probable HAF family extracellular repeat protein
MRKPLVLQVMPGDAHRLAATSTVAIGINASGDIVGTYRGTSTNEIGLVYRGGTYTTLDIGIETLACGINASGHIVGTYNKAGQDHGFLYNPNSGTYTTLDAP